MLLENIFLLTDARIYRLDTGRPNRIMGLLRNRQVYPTG
jgi:hypothetical protein